jgi:phage gp46-like protein
MDPGGLETASFISLFTSTGWVGNALQPDDPNKQIGSTFEQTLRRPITSQGLLDIEREAKDAHLWFISVGAATKVDAVATAPSRNRVNLVIFLTQPDGTVLEFKYNLNWSASRISAAIDNGSL